ncbi:PhoD-like protein [Macrolepiota fuliginosa MF-IS2]|uniref:PhoD-like protein n=1 Tax=Macrolepiota fuliginosa MF-IS2 TaxID=1400762 RepID=A0A9P6C8R2_9AGAR|nr:PhoD-like protein [Macrolepiota fuliginosa MF-IS2]
MDRRPSMNINSNRQMITPSFKQGSGSLSSAQCCVRTLPKMRFLFISLLVFAATAHADVARLDNNLAFRSPFFDEPQFAHDTIAISRRNIQPARRDTVDATRFKDEPYPGFFTSDFSNAPTIWSSGVNFTHSIASGDPFDTSVILWTRAMPLPSSSGQLPDQSVPVCVSFKIGTAKDLSGRPSDSGEVFTTYDIDFTVKVEASGLKPDTKYFFQFADCTNPNTVSPVGTTRTLASVNTPAEKVNGGKPLTLGVFSCSQFQAGWFNAYGFAAHNITPDIFVHLGDYIYESVGGGDGIGRAVLGRELATIHDYRQRLEQYRSDPDLQFAHQSAPWITVWDDHEVADNTWKAGTTDSNDTAAGCTFSPSGACFTDRKLAGVRAYHEWMPIRQVDAQDQLRIWRNFQIGKLLDLSMLDTRQYDRDVTDVGYNTAVVGSLADEPRRSLMGPNQEKWLLDTLSESKSRGAIWRVVGQQIVFIELNEGGFLDFDAWDGYRSNRNRILDHLYNNDISNTIILSGDSHANWVSDLAHTNDTMTYDPATGRGAIGVEFAGTGVTSTTAPFDGNTFDAATNFSSIFVKDNIDLQWSEGFFRGFFTLEVSPKAINATYYSMRDVTFRNLDGFAIASFLVKAGDNRLSRPVAGGKVLSGALKSQVVN